MENFSLIVEFQVRPEALEQFNALIAQNASSSVADEPGCLQFDVLRLVDDPCHVVLYEIYRDEAAFKNEHMPASHTRQFLEQAKPLTVSQTVKKMLRTHAPSKPGAAR